MIRKRKYPVVEELSNNPEDYIELAEDPFISIQGEGYYNIGKPALFIRLYGCNFKCYFCDTLHAVLKRHHDRNISAYNYEVLYNWLETDLLPTYSKRGKKLIVFTGGEPFYNYNQSRMVKVIDMLLERSNYKDLFEFAIETNGSMFNSTYQIPDTLKRLGKRLTLSISPKIFIFREHYKDYKEPDIEANIEYKFVVSELNDRAIFGIDGIIRNFLHKHNIDTDKRPIIIQPMQIIRQNPDYNVLMYSDICKKCIELGYRFNLQLHKIMRLK